MQLNLINTQAHAVFAKVTPMSAVVLDVMFPPKSGYLFGRDIEPFLQLYVQDAAHSLAVAGTTAGSAKRTSCFVELTITPHADARANGAHDVVVWEFNPNSRKLFLGRYIRAEGGYSVRVHVFDVLKRDTGAEESLSLSLAHKRVPAGL